MDVFVSYSHKDSTLRHAIANELASKGRNIAKYDKKELTPGDELFAKLNEILAQCDCVVVLITGNSWDSFAVRDEITAAATLNIPIIPIKESCVTTDQMPEAVKSKLYIKYEPNNIENTLGNLNDALDKISRNRLGPQNGKSVVYDPMSVAYHKENLVRAYNTLGESHYLFLMVGFTCCLKTTIARRLSKLMKVPVIETSCLSNERYDNADNRTERYDFAYKLADVILGNGLSVIVDGTYLFRKMRQPFYELAIDKNVEEIIVVHCDYSNEKILRAKLRYKKYMLDKPYSRCLKDFEHGKMDKPEEDYECKTGKMSLVKFDSSTLLVSDDVANKGLANVVKELIRDSAATGRLFE